MTPDLFQADLSALDFSEPARQARVARVQLVDVESGHATRWDAIENTYRLADAAQQALPGVDIRNVFLVSIYLKGAHPNPADCPLVDAIFVPRDQHVELQAILNRQYPVAQYGQCIQCGLNPYRPQKGEPKFRAWKSGARPHPQVKLDIVSNLPPENTPVNGQLKPL